MTCRNRAVLSILFLVVWGPRSCKLVEVNRRDVEEILLPCFAETSVSLQELKVEWKRIDSKAVVYLYQGGGSKPESQNNAYMNRAFFSAEEAMKGNYSLLLRNVTENDTGDYICSVYGKEKSLECTVAVTETEYLVVSGTGLVVTSNVGGEVTMTCSVHSHSPPEEVSWKKLGSDKSLTLIILFQDNETHADSGHESYRDRVALFASEILKGNFSLSLKDVKTEDRGKYICEAHSGQLSASTSVFVYLGLSSKHILVLTSCLAAVILAFAVSITVAATKEKTMITDLRTLVLHCVLSIGPGVIMFGAFVLWGVIEGQQGEVATCSMLSLTRVILLFKTSQCNEELYEMYRKIKDFLSRNCYFLQYIIITSVLSWAIFYNIWHTEGESEALVFVGMTSGLSLHMGIKLFFGGKGFLEMMDFFFLFTVSFGSRTLREGMYILVGHRSMCGTRMRPVVI
ncbi:hypothetical protein ACEWY4_015239 [Coilia grayii]|uniref:Ig-like domain-containing protein n=1 Tax=Coilia grayii TaxID=363190 RepID=A0ABD1JMF7_9TELE